MEHVETSSYVQNLLAGSIAASITSKGDILFWRRGEQKGKEKGKLPMAQPGRQVTAIPQTGIFPLGVLTCGAGGTP